MRMYRHVMGRRKRSLIVILAQAIARFHVISVPGYRFYQVVSIKDRYLAYIS